MTSSLCLMEEVILSTFLSPLKFFIRIFVVTLLSKQSSGISPNLLTSSVFTRLLPTTKTTLGLHLVTRSSVLSLSSRVVYTPDTLRWKSRPDPDVSLRGPLSISFPFYLRFFISFFIKSLLILSYSIRFRFSVVPVVTIYNQVTFLLILTSKNPLLQSLFSVLIGLTCFSIVQNKDHYHLIH